MKEKFLLVEDSGGNTVWINKDHIVSIEIKYHGNGGETFVDISTTNLPHNFTIRPFATKNDAVHYVLGYI